MMQQNGFVRLDNALWVSMKENRWRLSHLSGVNCTDAREYKSLINNSVLTHVPPIIEHQIKHLYNKAYDWDCYFIGDINDVKDIINIGSYVIITRNKEYVAGTPANIKQIKELGK